MCSTYDLLIQVSIFNSHNGETVIKILNENVESEWNIWTALDAWNSHLSHSMCKLVIKRFNTKYSPWETSAQLNVSHWPKRSDFSENHARYELRKLLIIKKLIWISKSISNVSFWFYIFVWYLDNCLAIVRIKYTNLY
jgi:hypothetical protein